MVLKWIKGLLRKPYHFGLMAVSYLKVKANGCAKTQLEIGSGPTRRSGWITLDMCKGADVFWDLRYKTPFKESSFDRVYCSHVLEHFSYRELRKMLREVHRLLRPNGEFLIAVPDASLYVEAYLGKRDADELMQYEPAIASRKSMDVLNYIFTWMGITNSCSTLRIWPFTVARRVL